MLQEGGRARLWKEGSAHAAARSWGPPAGVPSSVACGALENEQDTEGGGAGKLLAAGGSQKAL